MKYLALIGACLALVFAACGGSGSDQATTRSLTATEEVGRTAKEGGSAGKSPRHHSGPTVRMSKAEIAKLPPLRIPTPSGPPPRRLVIIDLRKGWGPAATKTDAVSARYIEDTYPQARKGRQGALSGGEVDLTSYRLERTKGFRAGLPGMKVGGRRELIVPPKVAYPRWKPSWGYAPYVSVFVVDLLGVEPR